MRAGGPVRQPYAGFDFIPQSWIYEFICCTVEVSAIPKKPSKKGEMPQAGTTQLLQRAFETQLFLVFIGKLHFLGSEDMFQSGDYSRPPPAVSTAVPVSSAAPPGASSSLSGAVLRIRDVYPGSRILDPKTATKEGGEKKIKLMSYFFCSDKYHKMENYFFLNW